MPGAPEGEWIIAPRAAQLLGLSLKSLYQLIDRGELDAEVTMRTGRPRQRRQVRLRRVAVDEYLDRARVKPGELRHLYPARATGRYG